MEEPKGATTGKLILDSLTSVELFKTDMRAAREEMNGWIFDDLAPVRTILESFVQRRIAILEKLKSGFVKRLEDQGVHVEDTQKLADAIEELRQWRDDFFADWPAELEPLPALDRDLVDQVRAAFGRGEKGLSRDQMVWGVDSRGS